MTQFKPDLESINSVIYTRADGRKEGVITPAESCFFNTACEWEKGGKKTYCPDLSALERDGEIRAGIKTSLETDAADEILSDSLQALDKVQSKHSNAKLIVVGKDVSHVRRLQKKLINVGRVAEMATSHDTEGAKAAIKQFKRGDVDILVTCQMCYEGLDCKSIKVVCLLTHIRTTPWIHQAIARGTRFDPDGPVDQKCYVFTLKDQKMQEIMQRIKDEDLAIALDPTETESGESNEGGAAHEPVVPLSSAVQDFQWTDLDTGADLSVEAVMQSVTEIVGSTITVEQANRLAERLYSKPNPVELHPPTPRELNDKYRQQIERSARRIAANTGLEPQVVNREIKSRFGKPRNEMTNHELLEVLNYVGNWEARSDQTDSMSEDWEVTCDFPVE